MILEEAVMLFRRLGVDVRMLSPDEFSAAYYQLALRYHPDISPRTHELMANINAARTTILKAFRRHCDGLADDDAYGCGRTGFWEHPQPRRRSMG